MNRTISSLVVSSSLALCASGCGSSSLMDAPDMAVAPPDIATPPDLYFNSQLIKDRPYDSQAAADESKPVALVLALHGLGDTGPNFVKAAGLLSLATRKGFAIAYPTGTGSQFGNYWNATAECCGYLDANGTPPDDVAYLNAVITDMTRTHNIDGKRIYLVGLSNGGFMSHRLACELSPRIAAIFSISGAQWTDATKCQPTAPVNVVELHGTADTTVPYDGGKLQGFGPTVNSALQTIGVWADRNKCMATPDTSAPPLDIDGSIAGNETTLQVYKGCAPGGATELWTVKGGMHVPRFSGTALETIYTWLMAHPKG